MSQKLVLHRSIFVRFAQKRSPPVIYYRNCCFQSHAKRHFKQFILSGLICTNRIQFRSQHMDVRVVLNRLSPSTKKKIMNYGTRYQKRRTYVPYVTLHLTKHQYSLGMDFVFYFYGGL